MTPRLLAGAGAAGCAVVLAGCAGRPQSALEGAGTRSAAINDNTWLMIIVGGVVWALVVAALIVALFRRRRGDDEHSRGGGLAVVIGGLVLPAVIIVLITAHAITILDRIDPRAGGDGTVIEVTGKQWWWEVRYPDDEVVTANEIHIPTGERVTLKLDTDNVIHSFWLPALTGKMDLIPGRTNETWIETDEPGTYWGQCAEYCGLQHARMRFVVVAHEPAEYASWLAAQRRTAEAPSELSATTQDPLVADGYEVFMSSSCVYCHTIAGTDAQGVVGPDLTHLASRETIAAGTLPNTRGNLAGWILDPQSTKPGARMPATDLSGDEVQALLAYLETLR